MYAFLTLLCILIVLFVIYKTVRPQSDGFEGHVPLNTDSKPILPPTIPVAELPVASSYKPSDLPGSLPSAPYQQIGSNLPSPYKDPSLIKTTRQRILNVLEQIKGFLAFQAQEIEDRSDPTIQLPLNTARSDFQRLESEANVLQRNPGLTPHMTVLEIAQIEDNLAYLQKEVELIGSNRPFQGPQHDIDLEGFHGDYRHADDSDTSNGPVATQAQLSDFSTRIQKTIVALSASGTTDPIVQARVGNLTALKTAVDKVIQDLTTKKISPSDVKILGSDIENALPALGKADTPIIPLLQKLVDKSDTIDQSYVDALSTLGSYAKTFLDNATASMSFNVKYNDSEEKDMNDTLSHNYRKSSLTDTGFPSPYDLKQVSEGPALNDIAIMDVATDRFAQDPRAEGRTPATGEERGNYTGTVGAGTFDWKGRCKEITDQIKKRGLDPTDYGIMPDKVATGPSFSWKGYTKMICTRLQASSMPRMDEMCGCPPGNWKGWNA